MYCCSLYVVEDEASFTEKRKEECIVTAVRNCCSSHDASAGYLRF